MALFVFIPVVAAVVGGAIWGVVDWLRAYGSGLNPFPYFDSIHYQVEPFRFEKPGTLLGSIEDLNNWYNLNFRGATRFGSGLGFIFGAFFSMSLFEQEALALRIVAGVVAGAAMGGRSALMLGSGARWSLIGYLVGASIGALYMTISAAPPKFRKLPDFQLPEPGASSL
ncbi:MAG TPA: hypothetical protein V6C97_07615 [Oculatellaceae cyanobacterium]